MNKFKTLTIGCVIAACALSSASTVMAAEYWRWKGEDGVIHYGSTPPKGVEAEKVVTYGGVSKSANTNTNSQSNGDTAEDTEPKVELTPEMQALKKERCEEERKRLAVFEKPGRIRMKQADGSTKYLSVEEIQKEIATTKQVIADTCN